MEFRGLDRPGAILERLKVLSARHIPVFDGHTLSTILGHPDLEPEFVKTATSASSVICCRVSPTQKSAIAEAIKKYTSLRVCGIGDGGNDVGLIQAAHVGVGIEGKEGKQASLAADFSLLEFKCLNGLVLWHGRLSYKRTAKLSHFIFHRGLLISVVQILFSCLFYFSAIPIYNGYLMLGYTTIYTTLPVFSIVLDEDGTVSSIMKFPNLYRSLQRGRALSFTVFLWWIWKSVYQASITILLAIVLFPDSFLNIVAITFTSLIVTELLNVLTEVLTM
jgi:phospholipid-translocating ATPase